MKNEVETSKMNPTNKAQTGKEKNTNTLQREKNSLPKTGDKALGIASILGGTLVLLAGVILFRRKKA
ncbi:Predicted outer membrane protein [Listeria fleischmannii subsp. fleischmannii]|uniref:Predicted outer membrane protein n=1 Tax=Listeria fleischmannii subsp. fleischmannii TaxID=1671902 RepID=A0A2X3HB74_9LIST|nr:LPXTG cell wall anchor domain-containing protein [Listeria fleischmannii]SQC71816.1 Predicted outer membrane protein [Listeria fleischmannii subsp. fleischmannii]